MYRIKASGAGRPGVEFKTFNNRWGQCPLRDRFQGPSAMWQGPQGEQERMTQGSLGAVTFPSWWGDDFCPFPPTHTVCQQRAGLTLTWYLECPCSPGSSAEVNSGSPVPTALCLPQKQPERPALSSTTWIPGSRRPISYLLAAVSPFLAHSGGTRWAFRLVPIFWP